ncbi:aldo/keto reductase [Marisediminicola sp. LYQ134]|uniref:aldo/keto reductase n=1 Tax=unclassified Marisediminicola TaxID=2618316 RepID=UPI00398394F0
MTNAPPPALPLARRRAADAGLRDRAVIAARTVIPTPGPPPATGPIVLRRRTIGSTDLVVYPLALSGNVFGWTADDESTGGILDAYRDFGGNFIDTADSYAAGRSEIMIGNWMRRRRNRDDIVLATKVGKSADNPGVTQEAITRSVTASLERLRCDHIDLLYLHTDDSTVAFEETLLAVDALVTAGKVRHFGLSDHSSNRLIEARVITAQMGVAPVAAVQTRYNLLHRSDYEGTVARLAGHLGLGVMPRFALASGFLSGKYRTRGDVARSRRQGDISRYLSKRGLRTVAALEAVAREHHVAAATIAIAWLLSKPLVVAPVASASSPDQIADLMAASSVQLTRHQVALLDGASR